MLRLRLLALPFLILAFGSNAGAANLTIGVEDLEYFPQYGVVNGVYGGYGRELLDAYARDRGHHIDYVPLPISRLFADFLAGKLDLKYPDNPGWMPEAKVGKGVRYSDPVVAFVDGLSVPAAKKGQPLTALRTIGTVRGFTPAGVKDMLASGQVTLVENANFAGLVQQAIQGRVDATLANIAVVKGQLRSLGQPDALVFDANLPYTKSNYYLSTLNRPEILADFNQWQKEKHEFIAALKRRYDVEAGVE